MANNDDGAKTPVDAYGLEVLRYVAENDPDKADKYRFRTTSTGESAIIGANADYSFSEVTLPKDGTWVKITGLPLGNALNVQNPEDSQTVIYVNAISPTQSSALVDGVTKGMEIYIRGERNYVVKTDESVIEIWCRVKDTTLTEDTVINVEQFG